MEFRTALSLPSLVLLLGLAGCTSQAHAPATIAAEGTLPKTQVFVMGMIHSGHLTSERYGIDVIQDTIRSIQPDVICTEIPPANWPSTLATWQERQVVEDSRVRVFPEYVDAMMPLMGELDFTVEPCAAWTPEMSSARSARIRAFQSSPEDAAANEAYLADEEWIAAWLAANPGIRPDDDPHYIHSPEYDLRTKAELGPYEHHLNEVIGAPGGWTYINEGHFALIEEAIAKHQGKRILVTFGAGHKYWFLERLRSMPSVELMAIRPHLPWVRDEPEPDGLAQSTQELVDAFCLGYDLMRATWSKRPGADLALLAGGSLGLAELLADEGELQHPDEFLDQPALSNFRVFSTSLYSPSAPGTSYLVVADARLPREGPEQMATLSAILRPESEAGVSPPTFRWMELMLPQIPAQKAEVK